MALTVAVAGRPLELLPERAAFDPESRTLLVADAHLGKAQAFRRLGVPVPGGTTADNLQMLSRLIDRTGALGIVFLGDLLHARHGRSPALLEAVAQWRARHAGLELRLVRGNHDSRAGDPPPEWGVDVVDEPWPLGPWALCHHPNVVPGSYVLAGHLHPAVTLGRGTDRLRLPCFHFGAAVGVLPAFGAFTGLHTIERAPGDHVVAVVHDDLRLLPG